MVLNSSSFIPWLRRSLSAYIDCAHLLMTSRTCSLTDKWSLGRRAFWLMSCERFPVESVADRCGFGICYFRRLFPSGSILIIAAVAYVARCLSLLPLTFIWPRCVGIRTFPLPLRTFRGLFLLPIQSKVGLFPPPKGHNPRLSPNDN